MANENELIEGEIVTTDLSALAVMVKAEIDSNVSTAKQYPRSITAFRKEMLEYVTLSEPIAEACIFALPRGKEKNAAGKWVPVFIEGPSVRFSEMLISSFGNCRSGARIVGEEKEFIIAEGFFHDLEKNVAVKCEIKRRITGKNGRYNSDMIAVTGNAASSIARRNAALQGIPKALWQEMYDAAKKTAIGDSKTLAAKRLDMMGYFMKLNVTAETIFEFMGVQGVEDIGLDELATLKGIATAIKEGSISVDNAFKPESGERNQNGKKIFEHIEGLNKEETTIDLQTVYKKLTDYAGETGETPDDLISRFTKGKVSALIDLEGKPVPYLNDIMLMIETEREAK